MIALTFFATWDSYPVIFTLVVGLLLGSPGGFPSFVLSLSKGRFCETWFDKLTTNGWDRWPS
jgi:hypothetical protein